MLIVKIFNTGPKEKNKVTMAGFVQNTLYSGTLEILKKVSWHVVWYDTGLV